RLSNSPCAGRFYRSMADLAGCARAPCPIAEPSVPIIVPTNVQAVLRSRTELLMGTGGSTGGQTCQFDAPAGSGRPSRAGSRHHLYGFHAHVMLASGLPG